LHEGLGAVYACENGTKEKRIMPIHNNTKEQSRAEFLRQADENKLSFSALCRNFGISRVTGYKWVKRSKAGGSLSDGSHINLGTPGNKTAPQTEVMVIAVRRQMPGLGAKKIHKMLENDGVLGLPSVRTCNTIIKRNGLVSEAASQAATPYIRFVKEEPNVMWQADFKGKYTLLNGVECHPLSLLDDYSRFCLCADAKLNEQFFGTRESFIYAFRMYGLPWILLCDNGNPWGAAQSGGHTRFEVWLLDLDILPVHIRAHHPQTQGKVERFNRSFKEEYLRFCLPKDMEAAQAQRLEYQAFYNNRRPHEALGMRTPATVYRPSERAYSEQIAPWVYESGQDIRKLKQSGCLSYAGQGYYLSEAFAGKTVSVVASSVDGFVNVVYRNFKIARIDLRQRSVVSRHIWRVTDDPSSRP
jgi:transposase InsO family protein